MFTYHPTVLTYVMEARAADDARRPHHVAPAATSSRWSDLLARVRSIVNVHNEHRPGPIPARVTR